MQRNLMRQYECIQFNFPIIQLSKSMSLPNPQCPKWFWVVNLWMHKPLKVFQINRKLTIGFRPLWELIQPLKYQLYIIISTLLFTNHITI